MARTIEETDERSESGETDEPDAGREAGEHADEGRVIDEPAGDDSGGRRTLLLLGVVLLALVGVAAFLAWRRNAPISRMLRDRDS